MLFMSSVGHAFMPIHCCLVSAAGKGLTSWLSFVMFIFFFCHFPRGIRGQVWYLIVSIPDLFHFSYFQYDIDEYPCDKFRQHQPSIFART